MKKNSLLAAAMLVILSVMAVSAQEGTKDYSGDWTLDVAKSDLGGRSRIESMTMKVMQSSETLTFTRTAKRSESGRPGRGMRRGGGGAQEYDLTGKETTAEAGGRFGGKIKKNAVADGAGGLTLTSNMEIETPRGAVSIKTVETWVLSEDGKTLAISTKRETPRRTRNTKMIFTKQ